MEKNMKDEMNTNVVTKKMAENEECRIKIVDSKGYDIEQFLCRCGNKTSSKLY